MNNTLVLDGVLSIEQCESLIKEGTASMVDSELAGVMGYRWSEFDQNTHPIIAPITSALTQEYVKHFPAINLTQTQWYTGKWRFKHFPPGYHFASWHSEHCFAHPYRIGCIIFYLSDHNCGTEFYSTREVITSKAGRAVIFPTSWTHTHRGQLCPDKKDRYIMSTYMYLTDKK